MGTQVLARPDSGFAPSIRRDIDEVTPAGAYGLARQMEVLGRYGLKGVFLVEAYSPRPSGLGLYGGSWTRCSHGDTKFNCMLIRNSWRGCYARSLRIAAELKNFTDRDQLRLVSRALENLQRRPHAGSRAELGLDRKLVREGVTEAFAARRS